MLEKLTEKTNEILDSRLFGTNTEVKDVLLFGAGVSIPILFGYSLKRYLGYTPKLKEKIPFSHLLNGGNILAKIFENQKIKYIFSLNELEFVTIEKGCEQLGIKVLHMKDVNNAITAASGIYRMTRQPGVIFVTSNSEILTLINGIINSNSENIPLIIIGIKPIVNSKPFDKEIFNKFFKFNKSISDISEITPIVENSFIKIMDGEPGAAFIEIGHDILLPEEMTRKIYEKEEQTRGGSLWFNRIWNNIQLDLKYPSEDTEISFHYPLRKQSKIPSTSVVNGILKKLLNAKTPVMIIGDECLLSDQIDNKELNLDSLKLAIKSLGIPTYLHGFSKSLVTNNNGLGHNIINDNLDYAIENSDFILAFGISSPRYLHELKINYLQTNVYSIHEFTQNNRSLFEPVNNMCFDPNSFLLHLGFVFPKVSNSKWSNWLSDLREKDSISSLIYEKKSSFKGTHLNPYLLLSSLKDTFKTFAKQPIIVSDIGSFADNASTTLGDCVDSWIQQSRLNSHPSSIGLAIASKLVFPESDVYMICDNNTISQCVEEFETLSHYHLPINIIVGNTEGLLESHDDSINHSHLSRTAYHKVINAYGGKGYILSRSDTSKDDIEKTFLDAKEKSLSLNKPVLLNCWIDQPKKSIIGSATQ
ncbi:hypothetical protein DLAC_03135 [Tieghemostelium lacteum]|uniref:2-hydroxyacyl-CoA lyase n=1 Tax=Tieghemostelium lacteum TaxID=361077 RepID=A0A152A2P8_TIELA|nr:hypothetical protein DLAC_03135 [Tieghemostelium lacteum]|eukprot:KYR00387.1 hypothetical protein DLAC_03135 [Tieghemostelium lacteum]